MPRRSALFVLAAASVAPAARAEVAVARTLDGVECRVVRETPDTAACYVGRSESNAQGTKDGGAPSACNLPAVRRDPSAASDVVGRVGSRALVPSLPGVNGFTAVILPDGRPGWIEDAWLKPTPRGESCDAVLLSNGRFGFRVK